MTFSENRGLWIGTLAAVVGLLSVGAWIGFSDGSSAKGSDAASRKTTQSTTSSRKTNSDGKTESRTGTASDKAAAAGKIHADWKLVAQSGLTGTELLDAQREVAAKAIAELGADPELEKFLKFLKDQGQGDLVKWMLEEGMEELFKGASRDESLKWFAELKDPKLQEKMGFLAGRHLDAKEIEPWIKRFTDIHVQSSLLSSYCAEYAEKDPTAAVKEFIRMKPAKVDFTGLARVMGSAPAGSDFIGLSGMVPGDSQSLAKSSRKALLGAWAKSEPQKAGEYVLSNTQQVHADQMGVVISGWAVKDVSGALDWVEALPEGDHRDYGMAALAQARVKDDPAWSRAAIDAIQNAKIRESATKEMNKPR